MQRSGAHFFAKILPPQIRRPRGRKNLFRVQTGMARPAGTVYAGSSDTLPPGGNLPWKSTDCPRRVERQTKIIGLVCHPVKEIRRTLAYYNTFW
ncbi:MAG: hypothetical protein CMJ81_08455 [Planctomycetaceae bacterium]|nr:hypothetical protein [Planctomycetaceae bacterium]